MTHLAPGDPQPIAFTVKNAARSVGVGETTIRAEIREGRLAAHYLGTKPIVLVVDLIRWVESLPLRASSEPTPRAGI